ncbi:MAG: hypothetical protein ACJ8AG_05305 [Ktedonobacteraceae bacterium]
MALNQPCPLPGLCRRAGLGRTLLAQRAAVRTPSSAKVSEVVADLTSRKDIDPLIERRRIDQLPG